MRGPLAQLDVSLLAVVGVGVALASLAVELGTRGAAGALVVVGCFAWLARRSGR